MSVSKPTVQVEYQSMVGSLLYTAMATRPDIAQAVLVVSKFYSKPMEIMVFCYLKKPANLALKYCKNGKSIIGVAI